MTSQRDPRRPGAAVRRGLEWAVDAALGGVLFAAPFVLGGRHPVGRLVYVAAVAGAAASWAAATCLSEQPRWRRSRAELLLAGAVGLVIFQLAPLPWSWLARLSPGVSALLPLWAPDRGLPEFSSWSTVSLVPEATRLGLGVLVAHALLFLVVLQRLERREDVERLLGWIAAAAAAMAVVGLAQRLLGNGKFLWVYQHPSRGADFPVRAAFANENHLCQFLALGLPALIWRFWLAQQRAGADRPSFGSPRPARFGLASFGWAAGLAAVLVAGLLTFSAGGVVVLAVAGASYVLAMARCAILGRKSLAALAAVGVPVAGALAIYGYQPLAGQLGRLRPASLEQLDEHLGRRAIWEADKGAIRQFPLLGAGVGVHRELYPVYFSQPAEVEYTHAESGYLQILVETGWAGLALALGAVVVCARWCLAAVAGTAEPRAKGAALAASCALAASVVHSLWDFVWYIPACMSLALLWAACACRLAQLAAAEADPSAAPPPETALRRPAAWAGAALLGGLLAAILAQQWPAAAAAGAWDAYLRLSLSSEQPAPGTSAYVARAEAMAGRLQRALRQNPRDARANLRMAAVQLRLFDARQQQAANPMSLSQIRDAALASRFPSREAQDQWLRRVVGSRRRHLDLAWRCARRALRLCPLQGEAYVYLSELAFLEGWPKSAAARLVDQALRVRPFSGEVLLAAGAEAALAGDVDQAAAYWRQAFHCGAEEQNRLIELLGPCADAARLVRLFSPDADGLRRIYRYYRRTGRQGDQAAAGALLAEALVRQASRRSGAAAARLWRDAALVLREIGRREAALAAAVQAVEQAPGDPGLRSLVAAWALADENYALAVEHWQWRRRRDPDNPEVLRGLAAARKGLLRRQAAAKPVTKR